jgi:cell division protein FtsB
MKRLGLTLVVLAVISGMAYYVFTHPNLDRAERLEHEVEKLREQNDDLEDKNEQLEKKVVALRDDPRLAERKARETSGLARPNEVVFQFDKPEEDVEVSVTLQVHADRLELAGNTLSIDQLEEGLVALMDDVPNARLSVEFDEEVDALRQQQVRDAVADSPLAPAEFVQQANE